MPRWGEFVLLDEIGRGGFGIVYRAWDDALKRDVALKVIDVRRLPGVGEDAFLREGQMLARVRHQNVVAVFSAQRIGGEVGLAMEYLKGRTLSNVIVQHGPLNAAEAVPIGITLCDALTAVHRGGLVHRDLKSSNVMRESGGRIVLMDFGAGRELLRGPGSWPELLGTPVYMPPEVLRGAPAATTSDIYSLGVLLFHLVTERYPVSGASFGEVLRAHDLRERLPLAECRPDLPAAFVEVVERALDPEAARRPATAVALKRELAAAMPIARGHPGRRPPRAAASVEPGTGRAATKHAAGLGVIPRALLGFGGALVLCVRSS